MLDDIGRARAHDELIGAFKSVGEALEATVAKLGLERFGAVGDPFDPAVHEALTHVHSPDVTETTCVEVLPAGLPLRGPRRPSGARRRRRPRLTRDTD